MNPRGLLGATILAAAAGWLTAVLAPRGPITTDQALLVMGAAFLAGLAGGALGRTRWALPAVAIAMAVGVELGRRELHAASLELRLDDPIGILAFAASRGFHGMLALLPMALGVLTGIGLARHRGWLPPRRRRRLPVGSAVLGLLVVGLVVAILVPASTPPVVGADGRVVPGSIAELSTVELGGDPHVVMIRAADPDAPVLLYLSGGPGQSDLALARALSSGWVDDVVFVGFDQRGNGKSYPAIDPVGDVTLDRAVDDVIELAEQLRERFDEERVYLMGESWGTILGVLAVQRRPDLFHAWIGSGQMVDIVETDQRIYRDLVALAQRTGDADLAAMLAQMGEPPYRDMPWSNARMLFLYDRLTPPFTPSEGYQQRHAASGLDPFGLLGSEYTLVEKASVLRGLIDTFELLYPQLYGLDLRTTVPRLEVPVWILDGVAELDGRRLLAREWYERLEAPAKHLVTLDDAAHAVAFEQADEVGRLLTDEIIPTTYGR